ncbi:FixH family protein [Streptomyces sp. NPDC018031]|uniref:copper resistance CopC/CopD family protein n=1 Tax=Streptomyces sp. NPDC018031 TaxID=3365033 RepID=UPI0037959667
MTPRATPRPTRLAPAAGRSTDRPRRAGRRLPALFGALLLALLSVLGPGAGPASAHAALTSTDPAEGSVLQAAPKRVTLTFSEGVLLSDDSLRVLDPRGKRVDSGEPGHVDGRSSTATVALHTGLPDGTFTVAWKAVSEDSHPVGGAFTFSIGAPSKTTVSVPTSAEPDATVDLLYGIGRYAAYAGFVLLVGGCLFAGVCRGSRPVARVAASGWVTLFAASLLLLLLRGPYAGGEGIGAAFDLGGLDEVLSTKPGAALLSRLLLLGAAAVFLAVLFGSYARQTRAAGADADPRARRDLAFGLAVGGTVVAAGLGATWAMAEHASVGIQPWLAMPVDVAHLLAVAVWLGGLVALLVTLRAGEPITARQVRRFSRTAFGAVLVLVGTGLYQSWRQVGSWDALTGTEYGRWLLLKVALVAVLVGLAAVSRRWTARLTDPAPEPATGPEPGPATGPEPRPAAAESGAATESGAAAGTPPGAGGGGVATAGRGTATAARDTDPDTAAADTGPDTLATDTPAPDTGPDTLAADTSPDLTAADTTAADPGPDAASEAAPETATDPGPATGAGSGAGPDGTDAADPVRAAQLARQRAARDRTASQRRRDSDPGRTALRRSVLAETAVAVVLLAVTTLLTGTQPGRAETEQAAARGAAPVAGPVTVKIPYDTGSKSGRGTAEVTLDPARKGDNEVHVYVTDAAGRPVDVAELKMSFTQREQDIGPLPVPLEHLSTGHWSATGYQLPVPGSWQVSMTVRTSDIDQVTEIETVKVGR